MGPLALIFRRSVAVFEGWLHRQETADRAIERGLVQAVSTDPQTLQGCELVILALPIGASAESRPRSCRGAPKDAVVTDVGSVKAPCWRHGVAWHPRFVASHPMAGTAESGVEAGSITCSGGGPGSRPQMPQHGFDGPRQVEAVARALGSHWTVAASQATTRPWP